jgi:hypothetical protein
MNNSVSGDGYIPSDEDIVPTDPGTRSFVEGLIVRGQAARPDSSGALPSGVTHEIVGETSDGLPILRRRRFGGSRLDEPGILNKAPAQK